MAARFDLIRQPFKDSARGSSPGECSSPRRSGQCPRILFFCLLLGLALGGSPTARADTDAGIAYMRQGSYIKALAELKPAAEAGDARAQINLASIYYYGLGISANFEHAFKWYRAAALQGDADGQIGLAILYAQGQGAPLDLAIAHMWLTLALDGLPPGHDRDRVGADREAIGQRMNAGQLQESASLVQDWYKNHKAP
jgi:hypothetical protein